MKRPNVLLLYTDQQRWDTIHYGGNPHISTPHLDRLAREGAIFDRCYCNSPLCMPSRQSMLSGMYPSTLGCACNGIEMPEDVLTVQKVLATYGYTTANLGKLHFKNHSNRDHREVHPAYGFDHLVVSDEPGCYPDAYIKWVEEKAPDKVNQCRVATPPAWKGIPVDAPDRRGTHPYVFEGPSSLTHSAFVADETIEFIQRQAGKTPWFAIAGFYAPHCPFNPPQEFVDLYDIEAMPLPYFDDFESAPWQNVKQNLTEAAWKKVKAYYYALISHVDDQIGKILKVLEESGQMEDTLIIFTADHGEHLGDHNLISKGPPGLDSCARVPLIVRWPEKITAGQKHTAIIESLDISAAIIDYCGIQQPPGFQGRSFRSLLAGEEYEKRSSAFIEFHEPFGASWKTVRTENYKYCRSADGVEILYDLVDDPHEQRNIASSADATEALNECRVELLQRWFTVENQFPLKTAEY
jgi:arylsulfatase A-like enzyme